MPAVRQVGVVRLKIDDFVKTNRGDCTLLHALYTLFNQRKGDRKFHIDGLTLLDIGPYDGTILYNSRMTPINTLTFACTGGDDVHFGMLSREGHFDDASPIVMTVPMADDNPEEANFVVGETLREFLSLGCVHGFFAIEKLAYSWRTEVFKEYASAPGANEEPSYIDFRSALSLTPWPEIESRQQTLDRIYKSRLSFRNI